MLSDLMDTSLFGVVDGYLALSGYVNGGVEMVHSLKLKGQTVVSSQSFVVNNSYLTGYQTVAAFNTAVKSYGSVDADQFLTPNLDDVVAIDVNP